MHDQYTGDTYRPNCHARTNTKPTCYDYFMSCFPKIQLDEMVLHTNEVLEAKHKKLTTIGEILKWFGVVLLATRYEFGSRRDLWSTTPTSKYMPAPCFGEKTGMSRDRFDLLWNNMVWSKQPTDRPEEKSHEGHRWMLVEGFIFNINGHRKKYYCPSWILCVDESMSRWYGLGGVWINIGLPHYIALDRKPENGCEIQDVCDGKTGIMLALKLVKSAQEEASIAAANPE